MSGIGKAIKNNIINPHDKYLMVQEKTAEVLSTDERKDCCNILYINTDGIPTIAEGIPVKKTSGLFSWFPKEGDRVEIKEQGKRVTIIGEAQDLKEVSDDTSSELDYYSDSLGGSVGGYVY